MGLPGDLRAGLQGFTGGKPAMRRGQTREPLYLWEFVPHHRAAAAIQLSLNPKPSDN